MGNADKTPQNDLSRDSNLLIAEEVASRLRLPLSTVYHLAKTGDLPAFQVGRSWRFHAHEIERLMGIPLREENREPEDTRAETGRSSLAKRSDPNSGN